MHARGFAALRLRPPQPFNTAWRHYRRRTMRLFPRIYCTIVTVPSLSFTHTDTTFLCVVRSKQRVSKRSKATGVDDLWGWGAVKLQQRWGLRAENAFMAEHRHTSGGTDGTLSTAESFVTRAVILSLVSTSSLGEWRNSPEGGCGCQPLTVVSIITILCTVINIIIIVIDVYTFPTSVVSATTINIHHHYHQRWPSMSLLYVSRHHYYYYYYY